MSTALATVLSVGVALAVAPRGPFDLWYLYVLMLLAAGCIGTWQWFDPPTSVGLGAVLTFGAMSSWLLLVGISDAGTTREAVTHSTSAFAIGFGVGAIAGLTPVLRHGFSIYVTGAVGFVLSGSMAGVVHGLAHAAQLDAYLVGVALAFSGGTTSVAWARNRRSVTNA